MQYDEKIKGSYNTFAKKKFESEVDAALKHQRIKFCTAVVKNIGIRLSQVVLRLTTCRSGFRKKRTVGVKKDLLWKVPGSSFLV